MVEIKALLFDVHRTLVDDSGFPREKIWKLLKAEGVKFNLDEYYCQYDELTRTIFNWAEIKDFIKVRDLHKKRLRIFYQKYQVQRDVNQDVQYLWRCMAESRIYPEVPQVLEELRQRYKIGLLSNADNDDPLIKLLLKANFHFDAIVTSEALRIYKPQQTIFDRAIETLGYDKNETLYIGDSQVSDVLGGKKAGLKVVWINRSAELLKEGFPEPDYQISDLRELLTILKG